MKKHCFIMALILMFVLPSLALAAEAPSDGTYTVEVTLSGGSGRATVESPAELVVSNETMSATIIWSSPNYTYMLVNGTQYNTINAEGNSTFGIPVAALDTEIAVSAETIAMSEPHLIEYTLYFDSTTLQSMNEGNRQIPTATIVVIVIAAVLVIVILLLAIRRRRNIREK